MIKYFCDFCKKEMEMSFKKPDTEIEITISKMVSTNNRTTQKAEHICSECNDKIISNLAGLGLEVDNGATT